MVKRLCTILVVALAMMQLTVGVSAKKRENPKADIKVGYVWRHLTVKGGEKLVERNYPYVLLANSMESKFFNAKNEYLDSLESTPSGRMFLKQIYKVEAEEFLRTKNEDALSMTSREGYMYVFKSRRDSEVTVYDYVGLDFGRCTDPLGDMRWEIGDSTKNLLGYECVNATTDYHGRRWTVWFAPEIPVQEGPWKLCGLPGLILEAYDASGQHAFTAEGIEKSGAALFPIYNGKKYSKMSRKDMWRSLREYRDNQKARTAAVLNMVPVEGEKITIEEPGSSPTDKKDDISRIDFLETDYR